MSSKELVARAREAAQSVIDANGQAFAALTAFAPGIKDALVDGLASAWLAGYESGINDMAKK